MLRLKALVGDEEPGVVAECLAGLMRLAPERSFDLIEQFLEKSDPFLRQAALLALGEAATRARSPAARHLPPRRFPKRPGADPP